MEPFKQLQVDPDKINKFIERQGHINYRWLSIGEIESGDWDLTETKFCDHHIFRSLKKHFEDGIDWENTEYYQRALKNTEKEELGWKRFTDDGTVDRYFSNLDALYKDMKHNGYKSNSDIKSTSNKKDVIMRPFWEHDEIAICIGRNGDLLFVDGRHRLAIAKLLSIDNVPTRVLSRHVEWILFKEELLRYIKQKQNNQTKHKLPHADLNTIRNKYPSYQLYKAIEDMLPTLDVEIIELDPGISGYLLHNLGAIGYECYAVNKENNPYLSELSEKLDLEFEIIDASKERNECKVTVLIHIGEKENFLKNYEDISADYILTDKCELGSNFRKVESKKVSDDVQINKYNVK